MSATPNIQRIIDELRAMFPTLKFQTYNRRHIGSNPLRPWSQHAGSEPAKGYYGNAVDIFDPADSYDSALLDRVYAYLVQNDERLRINHILWRVKNHHDHVHVDTFVALRSEWWRRPPPKGPVATIDDTGETYDTYDVDQEEDEVTIKQGHRGPVVSKIQKAINGWDGTDPLKVDGIYGADTTFAVKTYQEAAGMVQTGETDGVTMALLMEYVPDWIDNHTQCSGIISGGSVVIAGTIESTSTE